MRAPVRLTLTVQQAYGRGTLPTPAWLRRWACSALQRSARVTVRIVGGREGRALNQRFRGQDHATNVLTFTYPELQPLTGDLVLCAPVIAREAREQRKPLEAHYAHLVVHGMLHLQGYDHERSREARVMERIETGIVTALGFADPYRHEA